MLAHDPKIPNKDEPIDWRPSGFHEQKKNVTFSNKPTKRKVTA